MNVSISEIIVVVLIALLVIKPEDAPRVAYTIGRLLQSIRRSFHHFKNEVNTFVESANQIDEH